MKSSIHFRRALTTLTSLALLGSLIVAAPAAVSGASAGATRSITRAGTGSIGTGTFTPSGSSDGVLQDEFPGDEGADDAAQGPDPYSGSISLSNGVGHGASAPSAGKAKSNPAFKTGFEGLNLYQQRYARGGNQFTLEPPDQALCVGNGYVVEAVNDVINVFDTSGHSVLPDNTATNIVAGLPRDVNHAVDLNSFYGYPPAIDRAHGNARGQFLTDPTCIYDAQTGRFFMVVLTIENASTVNHLDIAVSQTANPTGLWNIYRTDVTNDGTSTGGTNPGPYLGDYPHIGADANGFYITTNAYPWCCNGFGGAQLYAFSKAQLAAGSAAVNLVHIDTSGMVNAPSDAGSTQPGFTVWPAQSPGAGSFATAANGTEYFMSSNAADEATHPVAGTGGDYVSNKIVVWTLQNTASLNTASPSLTLSNKLVGVNTYALPPKQTQAGSGTAPTTAAPQGYCINDTTTLTVAGTGCWRLILGAEPAHNEVISRPDSNDTRMQQVVYANGKLWGALDTAVTVGSENRAGIAWYIVNPSNATVRRQGTLGAAGHDFAYPAIGVTASGRGVMAFTASGDSIYPSAAYASIDAAGGVGAWNIVPGGAGAAPDDGFTSYKSQVGSPPRTRWGDYGAAAADGSAVWVASEYIAAACDYLTWGGPFIDGGTGPDNLLGSCAPTLGGVGVRTALGNWSTRISKFVP